MPVNMGAKDQNHTNPLMFQVSQTEEAQFRDQLECYISGGLFKVSFRKDYRPGKMGPGY